MERNRNQTRQRIIDAVGQLLAESGFVNIGINAIARKAGCDKVLIYRYFGGLPELLDAFADEGDHWPSPEYLLPGDDESSPANEKAIWVLQRTLQFLRDHEVTQEIMRWELHEENDLTGRLAELREKRGKALLARISKDMPDDSELDLAAIAAILHAGITYLVLRSKTADKYLGISLRSDIGWKRIEAAVSSAVTAVFPV